MINVTYFCSACVGISTAETNILCDPWLTDGIIDGSWFHYPKLDNPIQVIGEYELIYVSHVHEDHYDPRFLKAYLSHFPHTRILIPDFQNNYLARRMVSDRIAFEITDELAVGETKLKIFPNEKDKFDIDSAIVVKRHDHSVINMNDNGFNQEQLDSIKAYINGVKPKLALLPYTGAGPYPQTYFDLATQRDELIRKAEDKKLDFLQRYLRMSRYLDAEKTIPFAGTYVLCGKSSELNWYRGAADPVEVKEIDPRAVVLADGGRASINTGDLKPSSERTEAYSQADIDAYCEQYKDVKMDYEIFFENLDLDAVPFRRLLRTAYEAALRRTDCTEDYFFCVPYAEDSWFSCNVNTENPWFEFEQQPTAREPRSEVRLDPRYLFGLLTTVFHWNDAQVGSHLRTKRVPDQFSREAEMFLYFFHV